MTLGKLIGIGVGPGDPELLTLKAVKCLQEIDLLVYLSATNSESMAYEVASKHVPHSLDRMSFEAPMREGPAARAEFYETLAAQLRPRLDQGHLIGVLCLGDPMTYGSFIYLLDLLRPTYRFEIVPGITSISAAASVTGFPIGFSERSLGIFPASLPDDRLCELLEAHDQAAVLKVGRHFFRLQKVLRNLGQVESSVLLTDLGWPAEQIMNAADVKQAPSYFSILLTRRS